MKLLRTRLNVCVSVSHSSPLSVFSREGGRQRCSRPDAAGGSPPILHSSSTHTFLTSSSSFFQCSSVELTCESGAALAASLANGGLCPLSGDQVLSPGATRSMLSMMQVAGMKDYSSTFQYKVQAVK